MRRSTQLSAAEAAAAARADAAARAARAPTNGAGGDDAERGAEAARLAAENAALLDILAEAAVGNREVQAKLDAIRAKYRHKARLPAPLGALSSERLALLLFRRVLSPQPRASQSFPTE